MPKSDGWKNLTPGNPKPSDPEEMALLAPAKKVTQRKRNWARNRKIAFEYAFGSDTMERIAARHRLSRPRVRQILAEPDVQVYVDQLRQEREQEVRRRAMKHEAKAWEKLTNLMDDPKTPPQVLSKISLQLIEWTGNFSKPDLGLIIAGTNIDPVKKLGEFFDRMAAKERQLGEVTSFEEVPGE